jgi:carbonic anhydrase
LDPITDNLGNVTNYGNTSQIASLRLSKLIPFGIEKYYRYSGSLTTPECDEIVDWHVIDNPVLKISEEQLLNFQSIRDENKNEV